MELVVLVLAVAAGALIQSAIGFGFALVAAPVLALLAPQTLPGSLLLISVPLNLWVVLHEHASLDRAGFLRLVVGLIPGTIAGGFVMIAVPADLLAVVFGVAIVLASLASMRHAPARAGPGAVVAVGAASGLINTVAATGGPVVALLYQSKPGPVVRGTLAATFLASQVFSLVAIGAGGVLDGGDARMALRLLPGLIVGTILGRVVLRKLDDRWVRPGVLTFAIAAGALAILRGLL